MTRSVAVVCGIFMDAAVRENGKQPGPGNFVQPYFIHHPLSFVATSLKVFHERRRCLYALGAGGALEDPVSEIPTHGASGSSWIRKQQPRFPQAPRTRVANLGLHKNCKAVFTRGTRDGS
jgi:hypothetical protein